MKNQYTAGMGWRTLLLLCITVLVSAGGAVWYQYGDNLPALITDFKSGADLLPLVRDISMPSPLRVPGQGFTNVVLTSAGVFEFTNRERVAEGKPSLTRNTTLDAAAQKKLEDMFAQQYFEHISPDGVGPGDVVESVGYEFLTAGENLALGNFASDEALVDAWMDSPGHRENILATKFTEIGIAVGKGTFEGSTTWLAVQTFATPSSVCPLPPASLEENIETLKAQLEVEAAQLSQDFAQLEEQVKRINTLRDQAQQKIAEGNAEIEEGNRIYRETGDEEAAREHWEKGEALQAEGQALKEQVEALAADYTVQKSAYNDNVETFQTRSTQLSQEINEYNAQVRFTNTCVKEFGK